MGELRRLYPSLRITPKMLCLTIYPDLIREYEPLVNHWVMRYEAKHHYFKRLQATKCNYRNVPYTLSRCHQMLAACNFISGNLYTHDFAGSQSHGIDEDEDVYECVRYNGLKYEKNDVIAITHEDFIRIEEILIDDDGLLFLKGTHMDNLGYLQHYKAHIARDSTRPIQIYLSDIRCVHPLSEQDVPFTENLKPGSKLLCQKYYIYGVFNEA